MSVNKISLVEAVALILIITINRLYVNMPQAIITSCGSSAILNIVYISIIVIVLTMLITKLFKRFSNSDIIDVSEFLGGKFLKTLIGIILFVYIIFICSTLLRDFVETIHIIYYSDTPIVYLLTFFIVVCAIANLFGGKSIVRTNVILCTIIVISLLISFLSVAPNITIERFFPILGYGTYNTFFIGISNLYAFNGLLVLYLVPPMLKDKKDFRKASLIAVSIGAILLIFAAASILLAFSFSTTIENISPLYMLLSNNVFGRYFQHPESVFIFTWILGFMAYVNLCCMLLVGILKKLTNVKNSRPFLVPVCIAILIVALLPSSIMQLREIGSFVSKYFATPLTFIILPIILILANSKHKKLHKNSMEDSDI